MQDKHNRVSRKMIQNKAKEIYSSVGDGAGKEFVASRGWLQKFLKRNKLSLRRRTTMAQKDLDLLTEKLVSFVDFFGKAAKGAKSVALKTTGHEKSHLTVVLAAKADGTKLKPYIVFKGAIREVKAMQQQVTRAVIATSVNGWMNDTLTTHWLLNVVGKFSFTPRILVWDSYRCHISDTKAEMKTGYNITTAVIPGGCTKYVQAPDVMWNQPFKQSLHDAYYQWMAGD